MKDKPWARKRLETCGGCEKLRGFRVGKAAVFRCGACHCVVGSTHNPLGGKSVEITYTGKNGDTRVYDVKPVMKTTVWGATCPLNKWPSVEDNDGSVSENSGD